MERTWKPIAAGVLAIVAGAINIVVSMGIVLMMPVAASFAASLVSVGVLGILWLASGIMAIIGGIFALQRRHWGLSLAGAICALVPPSILLGILSTVFVTLARVEFEGGTASPATREPGLLSEKSACEADTECAPCDISQSPPSEGERNA